MIRVARRFALVGSAGELAIRLGTVPWPAGEALRAAESCFKAWLEQRGGLGASETSAAIAQVQSFFESHGSSRFELWGSGYADPDTEQKIYQRAGWRRKDGEGEWEYYVLPEAYKSEICRGMDTRRVTRELIERGLLLPDAAGKGAQLHSVPGYGRKRVYHFPSSILAGEPNHA